MQANATCGHSGGGELRAMTERNLRIILFGFGISHVRMTARVELTGVATAQPCSDCFVHSLGGGSLN